jgi:hypothetical protein
MPRRDSHHNCTQIGHLVIRITSVGTFPLYGARFHSRIAGIHDAEEWELGISNAFSWVKWKEYHQG